MSVLSFGRRAFGLALVMAVVAGSLQAAGGVVGVPEIDPNSLAGALALLTGGVMMIRRRAQ